jgi:hypothetical protein
MRRHCRDRATASAKVVRQVLFEVCHAVEIDRLVTDRAPDQPCSMLGGRPESRWC